MVSFLALSTAAVLTGSAILTNASPLNTALRPHQVRSFGPEVQRTFESYPVVDNSPWSVTSFGHVGDPVTIAEQFVKSKLAEDDEYYIESAYTSDLTGVTHVYMRQRVDGLDVVNGRINVHIDKQGQVVAYGNSFAPSSKARQPQRAWYIQAMERGMQVVYSTFFSQQKQQPYISPTQAVEALLHQVGLSYALSSSSGEMTVTSSLQGSTLLVENVPLALSPVRVKPAYHQQASGALTRVWDVELELEEHWYHAQLDARDGTLGGLVDWVADAVYYNVIPFGFNDPSATDQVLTKDPNDLYASPEGWHAQGSMSGGHMLTFNVTIGNNAYAHTNPDGGYGWEENYRPSGMIDDDTGDIVFNYTAQFDIQQPKEYEDAAVTNLFYWVNMAHDLFHRYGFDEKAGNFQEDNLGRGRPGDDCAGDAVIANAQDGSGRNNANFATPPDGRHGKMRMYVWDNTQPMRDGDFESGIIIHEYTHGVSNRLTGGPHDSSCLGWGEAGGMGEGWGDFVATIIRMTPEDTRESEFGMGGWANGGDGIRKYKYSTSMETNPSTYAIMDRFDYWGVHAKGEVWAEMLYEVYWNLVDKHGFTPNWFPPVPADDDDQSEALDYILSYGNTLALKLVIDGMAMQPCSPGFIQARDAILAADKALTGGENYCEIYKAFAKRGLGYGAKLSREDHWYEKRIESYTLKEGECQDDNDDNTESSWW
ncbi:hypothetical protein O0I10_003645 [Lichtheimia ornata]|uniref:Extracellular metalloproteinase n=1 Tax=Lichtheimia ornata TaxID=688661 RepID=A0AAD7V8K1_9FUNG|nr:uncharacterized protein O0I10_003645 [Lichtheimia ornata]KAJ8660598.1 hypothetical protein O0I10_003645 [Lichtheimia ornata]